MYFISVYGVNPSFSAKYFPVMMLRPSSSMLCIAKFPSSKNVL